ncbi:MAG: hypothetical protein ACREGJ_03990 [Candidatus Saccharimonadales bacterium]
MALSLGMKIKNKKTNRKKIFALLVVGVALISLGVYGWLQIPKNSSTQVSPRPVNDVNYSPATEEDKAAVDQRKEDLAKGQEQKPATNPAISLTVTRASQSDAGQPLNIRTVISGASSGTCEVNLTKSGQPTITKSFSVLFEATSAMCADANIPTSDFSTGGEWQLKIQVKKDARQSNIVEQSVKITK